MKNAFMLTHRHTHTPEAVSLSLSVNDVAFDTLPNSA